MTVHVDEIGTRKITTTRTGTVVVKSAGAARVNVVEKAIDVDLTQPPPATAVIHGGGARGPEGPPGPAPTPFIFHQDTPAMTWLIQHGKGYPPAITVLDSAGQAVEGDEFVVDENTTRIEFGAAFGGTAYLY